MKTASPFKTALLSLAMGAVALVSAQPVQAGKRVALVIGNDSYQHARPLNAAVNDARAIATALERLNFTVVKVENAGIGTMHEALEHAKLEAQSAEALVVYYAGHGIESAGVNYLIPVDAKLERETELKFQTVSLSSILEEVEKLNVPARMLILDCCRDNPLQGVRSWASTRSTGGGLGIPPQEDLADATLVVYSASPGKPALDRVGDGDRNSPFTTALLEQMPQPGVHSFEMFGRVEDSVKQRTGGRQAPRLFYNGSTQPFRSFAFNGSLSQSSSLAQITPDNPPTVNQSWTAQPQVPASLPPSAPLSLAPTEVLTLDGLFSGTAYAYYNDYSKKGILAKAQEKLKNAGLYAGQVDGDTGPKTQAAINSWQQSQGLPLSGRLDAETQASLGMGHMDEMSPPARTQRTAPPSQRTWQAPAPKRQPQKTPPPSFQEGIQNLRNGIQLIREIQGILPRR